MFMRLLFVLVLSLLLFKKTSKNGFCDTFAIHKTRFCDTMYHFFLKTDGTTSKVQVRLQQEKEGT
jgi:hypothetical protein